MKYLALLILCICMCSCLNEYRTMSFIVKYNYNSPNEDGWRNTKINPNKLAYLNNDDNSNMKLIQVKNDYSKILFKKYIIKNNFLIKSIDSTLKDTICPYIRYVKYFQDDSTKYIYITIQAKTTKNVITDYKEFQYRIAKFDTKKGRR